MLMMIVLLIISISINAVLLVNLNYRGHVIDDLEISKGRLVRRQAAEILDLLGKLRRILGNYTEHATRDTQIRNFIEENEEKYSAIIRQKNKELNIVSANSNV